jgi:DNA-directed RNA polymerase sigma subunit (sigma70/sigma32)
VAELPTRLDARSQAIVVERYGLDGRGGKTYAELGARYRMTGSRVGQVLEAALARMKGATVSGRGRLV